MSIQRDDSTDRFLDDMYGTVIIAGLEYDTSRAVFEVDPIAYREIQAKLESVAKDEPLDVWLKLDGDNELTHEANTYLTADGYAIEHYNVDVGQITRVEFDTLAESHQWYTDNGFQDFSS